MTESITTDFTYEAFKNPATGEELYLDVVKTKEVVRYYHGGGVEYFKYVLTKLDGGWVIMQSSANNDVFTIKQLPRSNKLQQAIQQLDELPSEMSSHLK